MARDAANAGLAIFPSAKLVDRFGRVVIMRLQHYENNFDIAMKMGSWKMNKYIDPGIDNLLCYMQFGNLTRG
jgi:hypothetical protein